MPARKGRPPPAPMTDAQKVEKAKAELERFNSKVRSDNRGQQELLTEHRSRRKPNHLSRPGNRQDQLRGFKAPEMKAVPKKGVDKRNPSGKSDLELGAERLKKLID